MKNRQLNQGLFLALLLTASVASAQDYPAADFQPKVVYRDASIADATPAASPVANAAAPCVSKEEKTETDAKYPAANFQPKVLFSAGS